MFATLVEDLMGLDDDAITDRFGELELQRRRLDAEMAAVVSVADGRGVWRRDGHFNVNGMGAGAGELVQHADRCVWSYGEVVEHVAGCG
jgi:hypothetical protein